MDRTGGRQEASRNRLFRWVGNVWSRVTNFFDPLRARLALALAVALVPIVVYDLVLAYRGYKDAEARGWTTVRQLAIVASNSQNALIEGTRRLMVGLGESAAVRQASSGTASAECSRTMARVAATLPEYSDLAVVDPEGRVRCSAVDRSIGASVADTPWFRGMKDTQGFTLAVSLGQCSCLIKIRGLIRFPFMKKLLVENESVNYQDRQARYRK